MIFFSFSVTYQVGDLVFAKKLGYMPWPAKVIDVCQDRQLILVLFLYTDDYHKVTYRKLWPYNEQTKAKFVTRQNLDYTEYGKAITMAEGIREHELGILHEVRNQRDTLHTEAVFIEQVNHLRSSLKVHQQNYIRAQLAFQRLLQLPLSQLLLIRNREAVESIRLLCRYVQHEAENPEEPRLVRTMAKRLMNRFASHFKTSQFWSHYCNLYHIYMRYTVPIAEQKE